MHYKGSQILELALDLKFWLAFFTAFLMMITNGLISTFMPIIISTFGFSSLNSLLLMMPAGAFAGTIQLVAPFLAMKFTNIRVWIIITCQAITTLAALLLWQLPRDATGGLLFGIYILPAMGGGYAVLMGLQLANVAGYTKRSIASSGLYIGYCFGNFVGPLVFLTKEKPLYTTGFIVCTVTSIIAAFLILAYWWVCKAENKKRDATGVMEGFDNAYEDDLTDMKNPQFRYIL
jgi:MFS family permease